MTTSTMSPVAEYMTWCDQNSGVIHHLSWPTYRDARAFTRSSVNTFSDLVMHITPLGYRLKAVTTRRAGFLWRRLEKTYIFERVIPLDPAQMFGGAVTVRVVPYIEDQLEHWLIRDHDYGAGHTP